MGMKKSKGKLPNFKRRKIRPAKCCGRRYRRGQGQIINGICYKCREKLVPEYEPEIKELNNIRMG